MKVAEGVEPTAATPAEMDESVWTAWTRKSSGLRQQVRFERGGWPRSAPRAYLFKRVQAGEDDLGIAGRGSGGGVDGEARRHDNFTFAILLATHDMRDKHNSVLLTISLQSVVGADHLPELGRRVLALELDSQHLARLAARRSQQVREPQRPPLVTLSPDSRFLGERVSQLD